MKAPLPPAIYFGDLVGPGQLVDTGGSDRDPVFVVLDFAGDTDLHGVFSLSCWRRTLSLLAKPAHLSFP